MHDPNDPSSFTAQAWQAWGLKPPSVQFYGQTTGVRATKLARLSFLDVGPLGINPLAYGERVQWLEAQRTLTILPDETPAAWVCAGVDISDLTLGVLERIGCYIVAEALDVDGIAVARFTSDGTDPTTSPPLAHPDLAVAPVLWHWELNDVGYSRRPASIGDTAAPTNITGSAMLPDWSDGRYGWDSHSHRMQMQLPELTRARLWLIIEGGRHAGGAPAWRVRVSGRLSGFRQTWGPRNAAFASAMERS